MRTSPSGGRPKLVANTQVTSQTSNHGIFRCRGNRWRLNTGDSNGRVLGVCAVRRLLKTLKKIWTRIIITYHAATIGPFVKLITTIIGNTVVGLSTNSKFIYHDIGGLAYLRLSALEGGGICIYSEVTNTRKVSCPSPLRHFFKLK